MDCVIKWGIRCINAIRIFFIEKTEKTEKTAEMR